MDDGNLPSEIAIIVPGPIFLIWWPDNPVPLIGLNLYEWIATLLNFGVLLRVPAGQEAILQALIATIFIRLAICWLLVVGFHVVKIVSAEKAFHDH